MTLGQKIKALRQERGLTQAALCDSTVTRNMLSRIEHDAATPSLSTLQALAKRLGISAGFFLDETDDAFPYRKMAVLPSLRAALSEGRYEDLLEELDTLGGRDEETDCLRSLAHLFLGQRLYRQGLLTSATSHLEKALAAGKDNPYCRQEGLAPAQTMLSAMEKVLEKKTPDMRDAEQKIDPGAESAPSLFDAYRYLLRLTVTAPYDFAARVYDSLPLRDPLQKKHIHARLSMAAHNDSRAAVLLEEIRADCEREEADPLFRLLVLTDAETVARRLNDYESAYHCLLEKNALLEKFSH